MTNSIGPLQEDLKMHAVVPKNWCEHLEPDLEMIQPIPDGKLNHMASCQECGHVGENWVCLTCYEVGKDMLRPDKC